MRLRTCVGAAVVLVAALAVAACTSSAERAVTGQVGAGGSGPATVPTRFSSSAITGSTLGSSSTAGPSAGRSVPPPAGWKTVWYDGVGGNVPADWQVASGTSFICSFGARPAAYLGPTHMFYPCPMPAPGRPGNNGLWVDASYGTPGASMIETSVHGIAVDIGLAADPMIAHQIEASLHYDPAAPDSVT